MADDDPNRKQGRDDEPQDQEQAEDREQTEDTEETEDTEDLPLQPPHPLVAALAKGLTRDTDRRLQDAVSRYDEAQKTLTAHPADQADDAAKDEAEAEAEKRRAAGVLANAIANDSSLPELYTFAGYLGGLLHDDKDPTRSYWQLLYLDAKLLTWLLIDEDNIIFRREVRDQTSPFGSRDYVWLKSDASVSQGEGPPQKNEIHARFLRGEFVSAGDFAASVTGGTYAPPTGPLCPLTPGCCGRRTR